jgi:hypothetical protein
MTRNEIVEEVIRLLRDHHSGRRGSINQEPYTHDFFALFAQAYNAGMMRGSDDVLYADALARIIVARAPELAEGPVWVLHRLWSDWTYSWDHAAERTASPDGQGPAPKPRTTLLNRTR